MLAGAVLAQSTGKTESVSANSPTDSLTYETVRNLVHSGRYDEAVIAGHLLVTRVVAEHDSLTLEVAEALDLLAIALRASGHSGDPQTLDHARRAVSIKERVLPANDRRTARSYVYLGILEHQLGHHPEAERAYSRARDIYAAALGTTHENYGESLYYLATLARDRGRHAEARETFEQAQMVLAEVLPPDHRKLINCREGLGLLLHDRGRFLEANDLLEMVYKTRTAALGERNPQVAKSALNLALNLQELGEYDRAIALCSQAVLTYEQSLGPEHPTVGYALLALAMLQTNDGDFSQAATLLDRALEIYLEQYGEQHPHVARVLDRQGLLAYQLGDYDEAGDRFDGALEIRRRLYGEEHVEVATCYLHLAMLDLERGRYCESERRYRDALAIYESVLLPGDYRIAWVLRDLAVLDVLARDGSRAAELFPRALAMLESASVPDPIEIAWCLHFYAGFRMGRGEYDAARSLYERAVSIYRRELGDHRLTGAMLIGLAECLARSGHPDQALRAALRADEIASEHLRLTARSLAERQALRYAMTVGSGLDVALSLLADHQLDHDAAYPGLIWSHAIRSRALVLDEMAMRHRMTSGMADPETRRIREELQTARQRLANLSVRDPGAIDASTYQEVLDAARENRERLERELATLPATGHELDAPLLDLEQVTGSLPDGSALIAYVVYRHLAAEARRDPRRSTTSYDVRRLPAERLVGVGGELSYIALVHGADRPAPVAVPLGSAGTIDSLIAAWRTSFEAERLLRAGSLERAEADCRAAGEPLRAAIWDPIVPHLGTAESIFVVPDGGIHLLPLAALPTVDGRYLVDEPLLLHYLTAERDLCVFATGGTPGDGLLTLGGADFDDRASLSARIPEQVRRASIPTVEAAGASIPPRGDRSGCEDLRTMRFDPLPATIRETARIAEIWNVAGGAGASVDGSLVSGQGARGTVIRLLRGAASEAAVKAHARGCRALHLATHGFFLGGDCRQARPGSRGLGGIAPGTGDRTPPIPGESPLVLAGLALAGANQRDLAAPDDDDGILTAEEIAALDLCDVQWAVLSACDTGLGRITAGEGVLGLRRAFRVAGVRTTVMSLWPVDDRATEMWMTDLYQAKWIDRFNTAEAVRHASRRMLSRQRNQHESTHPILWAGFVAAGDWH